MDDEQINPTGNCREPVKKGRGITKEPGASAMINPKKKRVEIQMDFEHYTPDGNSDPPLVPDQPLKKTRGITIGLKASNITNFDFDWTDLELRRSVEKKMGKAYGSWRNKLHGHFKNYPFIDDDNFSKFSTASSVASLKSSLPENPMIYDTSEISSSTNNFLSHRLSSSSSSSSSTSTNNFLSHRLSSSSSSTSWRLFLLTVTA
ncbi:hypothetical protein ACLB2K_013978 [Fragaria x ananassa]